MIACESESLQHTIQTLPTNSGTSARNSSQMNAIPLSEYEIRANFIPKEAMPEWELKFTTGETKEYILEICPYSECYICGEKFVDVMENTEMSGDLAALPTCDHLVCVACLLI